MTPSSSPSIMTPSSSPSTKTLSSSLVTISNATRPRASAASPIPTPGWAATWVAIWAAAACTSWAAVAAGSDITADRRANNRGRAGNGSASLAFQYPALRDQFGEQVRIDIAAGENDHDRLVPRVDFAREQCGETDRAARLDHELQFAKRKGHRGANLLVGGGDGAGEQFSVDRERDFARHLRHQRVADGARLGMMGLAMA